MLFGKQKMTKQTKQERREDGRESQREESLNELISEYSVHISNLQIQKCPRRTGGTALSGTGFYLSKANVSDAFYHQVGDMIIPLYQHTLFDIVKNAFELEGSGSDRDLFMDVLSHEGSHCISGLMDPGWKSIRERFQSDPLIRDFALAYAKLWEVNYHQGYKAINVYRYLELSDEARIVEELLTKKGSFQFFTDSQERESLIKRQRSGDPNDPEARLYQKSTSEGMQLFRAFLERYKDHSSVKIDSIQELTRLRSLIQEELDRI